MSETQQPPRPPNSTAEMRGGRMSTVGVPTEKSKNFAASSKRLLARLEPERWKVIFVGVLAVGSVSLLVAGPKVLGHATNVLYDGIISRFRGGPGIDFGELHFTLWIAVGLYAIGYVLAYGQAWLVAGVVQRTMHRMRAEVEDKLNAMPLAYIDGQARGDLLSRVTNDIDNVAQSMQQSISQLLTGLLTIVGVLIMMLTISWQLALIAIVTVPLSIWTMSAFFRQIPWEMEQAAQVDGATSWQAFRKVIVPLAAPGVFTAAILTFFFAWNEFVLAISLTSTTDARTVPAQMSFFVGPDPFNPPYSQLATASVIVTIPVIVIVLLFQRRIVAGLTSGAVKG